MSNGVIRQGMAIVMMCLAVSFFALGCTPAQIQFEQRTIYCGTAHDRALDCEIRFKNAGHEPLRISRVRPHCNCTSVEFDSVVPAGATGKILARTVYEFIHDTVATSVTIESNSLYDSVATVVLKAYVPPEGGQPQVRPAGSDEQTW